MPLSTGVDTGENSKSRTVVVLSGIRYLFSTALRWPCELVERLFNKGSVDKNKKQWYIFGAQLTNVRMLGLEKFNDDIFSALLLLAHLSMNRLLFKEKMSNYSFLKFRSICSPRRSPTLLEPRTSSSKGQSTFLNLLRLCFILHRVKIILSVTGF